MDHCLVDGNTANNIGAGIAIESNSTATLTNVTAANNVWASPRLQGWARIDGRLRGNETKDAKNTPAYK
jgi:parallel beta-helix repeat protein